MIQSIAALALVLALFALLVWLLRWLQQRTGGMQGQGTIRILRRTMLSGKHSLIEIEHNGEHMLLGLSPNNMTKLNHFSAKEQSTNKAHTP
ncbi:MAG: flagellar biosynthetic protein FliO [Mariprofundales bacterium]